jgi:hypothetical protein
LAALLATCQSSAEPSQRGVSDFADDPEKLLQ